MRYVMSRILGSDGGSKHLCSPGVHPPLGDRGGQRGGHSRATVRQWPEPSLHCADGWCRAARVALCAEGPAPDSSAMRA